MLDFSKYLFRCHSIGNLICSPKQLTNNQNETLLNYSERDKGLGKPLTELQKKDFISLQYKYNESQVYKLTESQKKNLRQVVFQEKYKRKFRSTNKYFDKGILTEKEARDMLSDLMGEALIKDEERRSNNYVNGLRDVKHNEYIIDLKNAFSLESYANIVEESENEKEGYLYQMDSYMDLWNLKTSLICHTLVDTPPHLLELDFRMVLKNQRYFNEITKELTESGIEAMKGIVYNHTFTEKALQDIINYAIQIHSDSFFEFNKNMFEDFTEIPIKERIHIIQHNYQEERIEQRNKSIEVAREYMNTVKIENNIKYNINN